MRQVLSISLPQAEVKTIKQKTKKRGFKSVSDYMKFLIREDDESDLISVSEILKASKEAEQEYKKGELIEADSIVDLL